MQNILDPLSQAASLWTGFFSTNATQATDPLSRLSSYGPLQSIGFLESTFSYSSAGKAVCVSGLVHVHVVGPTTQILYPGPANNFELTEFITSFLRRDTDIFATSLGPQSDISDTFPIFSKLCVPADAAESTKNYTSVHFLTHGGTLDHTYWDFADGYSYVDAAAAKGYATFSYDRLGAGHSAHPDPLQLVQAPLQVELAHSLIRMLRTGAIGGMPFAKVVGAGHSLGAAVTQGVASRHAEDLDALLLSGHSGFHAGSGTGFAAAGWQIANTLADREELRALPNGYYTLGPGYQTLQLAFFYYPHFDMEVFVKEFSTRQCTAVGETLTLGSLYMPTKYGKPVQILNGQQDYFYCQGNCLAEDGDVSADALEVFFPEREKERSEAVTLPNTGHNINMHYSRLDAFEKMLEFVGRVGIEA